MKITKKDVLWNYVGTIMALGSNLLLLPFLLYFLDSDILGLWYVFLSIGGLITLLDFGFTPTLSRNITYSWSGAKELVKEGVIFVEKSEPNIGLLKIVLVTCKNIYFKLTIIAFPALFILGTAYIFYISKNLDGYIHLISWFVFLTAVTINLYYGYYTTFLRGVGAISKYNKALVVSRFLQILLAIILLYFGLGLLAVSIAYLCYGLVYRLIAKNSFYKYDDIGMRINIDKTVVNKQTIKHTFEIIWHNSWRDGMVSLSNFISNQSTVIIASLFLSLTQTGIYSISIQIVTALASFSRALYGAYQPSLQASYVNNDINKSRKLISVAMFVYCIIFVVSFVGVIFIGIPILNLIKPDVSISIPVLIAIGLYEFLLIHHNIYASYISNTNNVQYMKSFLVSSIISVILSIILIIYTNLGIWALIIGQGFSQIIYNNWKWPYKVMKDLNTNPFKIFFTGFIEIKRIFSYELNKLHRFKRR